MVSVRTLFQYTIPLCMVIYAANLFFYYFIFLRTHVGLLVIVIVVCSKICSLFFLSGWGSTDCYSK